MTPAAPFVAKLAPDGNRLIYSTYLGGNYGDSGSAIAVDGEGNAYVAGSTSSTNFPTLSALSAIAHGNPVRDPLAPQSATNCLFVPLDAFVTKLSPGGALLYSTYLGGTHADSATDIAVDGEGAVHLVGETYSADFPITDRAFQTEFRPVSDAFFLRLAKNGKEILYSTYLGGNAGLEVSPGYLVRRSLGTPWTQTLRFRNASSQPISITDIYFLNEANTVRVDLVDTLPMTLPPKQAAEITLESEQTESRLRIRGEISGQPFRTTLEWLKLDEDPALLETAVSKDFLSQDWASAIALDTNGGACIAGMFGSLDAPHFGMPGPPPGDYELIECTDSAPSGNAFVARFKTNYQLEYLVLLGGSQWDGATSLVVDNTGSLYVAGWTSSPDFPARDSLQAKAGESDVFVAKLAPTGKPLLFSTLLGGDGADSAQCAALNLAGEICVGGYTTSSNFPVVHPIQAAFGSSTNGPPIYWDSDGFVARISAESPGQSVQLWQKVWLPGTFTSSSTNHVRIQFELEGANRSADAPVLQVNPTNVLVRVPVDLLDPDDALPEEYQPEVDLVIRVITFSQTAAVTNLLENWRLIWPRRLLFDEVFTAPVWAAGAARQLPTGPRTLLQFELNDPRLVNDPTTLATFLFSGRRTDGTAGVRVCNTAPFFPLPLRLGGELSVFEPNALGNGLSDAGFIHFPNLAAENEGLQFNVRRDGFHLIVVESQTNSPGPFPAPFQIHLTGNVGLARKLTNDVAEPRRGTRQEVLFNHPAPHRVQLDGSPGRNETALFKFNNLANVAIYPVAVLVPPTKNGFPLGQAPVRATDPAQPLDRTTPTARPPDLLTPRVGTVIDFTQVPVPAEPGVGGTVSGTVGGLLGRPVPGGAALQLPLMAEGGVSVSSLILDFGSGFEIVDGPGSDLVVRALEGSYSVKVGNTPFSDGFTAFGTVGTYTNEFDLTRTGMTSARYVLITAEPNVKLDAVAALHQFADNVSPVIGPVRQEKSATILVRRTKTADNPLDPFLQLFGPNAEFYGENESGFGDELSVDQSDAALIGLELKLDGFHRYLVRGYETQPDNQAIGSFLTRLETTGNYDKLKLIVSTNDEAATAPQKEGVIDRSRQRDCYLFQAAPGARINLVVNGKGNPALTDPLVELYDPEDFLIGANDDGIGRAKNAVLSLNLPITTAAGTALPGLNTYRVAVSGADRPGLGHPWDDAVAHVREVNGGRYELKVFTGALTEPTPLEPPKVKGIPASTLAAIAGPNGLALDLQGNLYLLGRDSGILSRIGSNGIVNVVAQLGLEAGAWYGPACDRQGNLYVSHFTGNEVLVIAPNGQVERIASGISQPANLMTDSYDTLYVSSRNTGKVYRIETGGVPNSLQTLNRSGNQSVADQVTEYATGISEPGALAFDGQGMLYVVERSNNQIGRVPVGGGTPTRFVQLDELAECLVFDANGNLLVGTSRGALLEIKPNGIVTSIGSGFAAVSGIGLDASGTLFLADPGKGLVVKAVFVDPQPAERTAQARLRCYSLRLEPAIATVEGETYTLTFTTGLLGNLSPNGELAPTFDPTDFSHTSRLLLEMPGLTEPVTGEIYLEVPAEIDANGNGVADFYEVSLSVDPIETQGDFYAGDATGWVIATWQRAAGAATGTCRVWAFPDASDPLPEFVHAFEVLEYAGSLTYTPAVGAVPGVIHLHPVYSALDAWSGPVIFAKAPADTFNELTLLEGSWTNMTGHSWWHQESRLHRSVSVTTEYTGRVDFRDGYLQSSDPDFTAWQIWIGDPNDTDGDFIPDLSDDPFVQPVAKPILAIGLQQGVLVFSIRAEIGANLDLEETSCLLPASWTPRISLTIERDLQTVILSLSSGTARFYRLRAR